MATIVSKYFGVLSYSEDSVVFFPTGLLAFEGNQHYVLISQPASQPLSFLQNLEEPELCFLVMPAAQVDPAFRLSLDSDSCVQLGLGAHAQPAVEDLLCLAIVNLDEDGHAPTANLRGPLVINVPARRGVQAVQYDADYSLRHPAPALHEVLFCS